jgi:hypothetical protein
MLKTVAVSSNKKTGPIAVTYRAGVRDTYGTCPKTCGLNPEPRTGADEIDRDYLAAMLTAVPRNGVDLFAFSGAGYSDCRAGSDCN